MEYLTAATVFGQPFPHLEEPTRQIVYFDPEFDAQIGWDAGQSPVLHTARVYTEGRAIFPCAASQAYHTVSRVIWCHALDRCGGFRVAALARRPCTETIDCNRTDRVVQEEMRAPPVCGTESHSAN
jgi:hypothetical protein